MIIKTQKCGRLKSLLVAFFSAGWVIPMYFAVSNYFSGMEDWLFSIRTNGPIFKVSRLWFPNIELAVAFGWLGLVIGGWSIYWNSSCVAQPGGAAEAPRAPR